MLILSGAVQHYDWGSPTTLPDFLGLPRDGRPWAEVWYGAHPSHPSTVLPASPSRPPCTLDRVVAADPTHWLGSATVERFGTTLPFLVKLLATCRALSLQVHPGPEQARAGFRREREAGLDAAHRNYVDAHHKPEVIVAITPLRALAGFRRPGDSRQDVALVEGLGAVHDCLGDPCEERGVERAFRMLQGLSPADLGRALAALRTAPATPALDLARELAEQFPGDRGALVSPLLNHVTVAPGQALSTATGTVHSYLDGFGLEVMASSDNVLRAGLTGKRVDVEEFAAVADFRPGRPPVRALECSWPAEGVCLQDLGSGVPDFHLEVLEVRGPGCVEIGGDGRVTMLVVLEGAPVLSDDASRTALVPGGAALAGAGSAVRVGGVGRVAVVTVPSVVEGRGARVVPAGSSRPRLVVG